MTSASWCSWLGVTLLLGSAGCQKKPDKASCEKLFAHVLSVNKPAEASPETWTQQQTEVTASVQKSFLEYCEQKMPLSQVSCGLAANTRQEMDGCDK